MGAFLLKEEELNEDEEVEQVKLSSFVHVAPKNSRNDLVKIIAICISLLVLCVVSTVIIFKPSNKKQPIIVIPQNNVIKKQMPDKEKHEDKQIYSYLSDIDEKEINKDRKIIQEELISRINKDAVMKNAPSKTNLEIKSENILGSDLDNQALSKIDDLIKSVLNNEKENNDKIKNDKNDLMAMDDLSVKNSEDLVDAGEGLQNYNQLTVNTSEGGFGPLRSDEEIEKFIENSHGVYRLKLGSFETHADAQKMIQNFYKHNENNPKITETPYYIIAVDDEKVSVVYKVLIGNFKSKKEAIEFSKLFLN